MVHDRLGLKVTSRANVLGAWSDGAENSLMMSTRGDPAAVRAAAAIGGAVAGQKAVLVFQPSLAGNEHMLSFDMPGDSKQIHKKLLDSGLHFHTLQPLDKGARVHIYANDQDTVDAVHKLTQKEGSNVDVISGSGEFIGNSSDTGTDEEQRDEARRVYEDVVNKAADSGALEKHDLRALWRDAHDHWRTATEKKAVKSAKSKRADSSIFDACLIQLDELIQRMDQRMDRLKH